MILLTPSEIQRLDALAVPSIRFDRIVLRAGDDDLFTWSL